MRTSIPHHGLIPVTPYQFGKLSGLVKAIMELTGAGPQTILLLL